MMDSLIVRHVVVTARLVRDFIRLAVRVDSSCVVVSVLSGVLVVVLSIHVHGIDVVLLGIVLVTIVSFLSTLPRTLTLVASASARADVTSRHHLLLPLLSLIILHPLHEKTFHSLHLFVAPRRANQTGWVEFVLVWRVPA